MLGENFGKCAETEKITYIEYKKGRNRNCEAYYYAASLDDGTIRIITMYIAESEKIMSDIMLEDEKNKNILDISGEIEEKLRKKLKEITRIRKLFL